MRMAVWRFRGLVGVLVIAGLAHVAAQAKPDFSGEWVLNKHESTLPPPVSNVESGVVRIDHRESNDVRYELLEVGRRLRATEQGRSPLGNHDAVWISDRR